MNDMYPADRDRQWDILEKLATEGLKEQRRARRWGLFFKLFFVIYLLVGLGLFVWQQDAIEPVGRHTALVDLRGVIGTDQDVESETISDALNEAFENSNTAGVILRINSPGGSPVHAGHINAEIQRLRQRYPDTPLHTVVTEVCASGGYYIAVASDKIFADKASIVGSIGVLMDGFGFVDAMQKLGVERRLITAGKYKSMLDPFSPLDSAVETHARALVDQVHQQFIDTVRKGRGDRLSEDPDIFSGLFWTGERALELGLIDGFGTAQSVARDIIGAEKIVNYTPQGGWLERFAEQMGAAIAKTIEIDTRFQFSGFR